MSLPSTLLYKNKISAAQSRAYTSNIQPTGASVYGPNDVMILNIPCNPNTVLSGADSFLKFNMTVTNGGTANALVRLSKAAAHGFISRLRLFSPNGVLLEDISEYSNLLSVLATHQRSVSKNTGVGSVVEGFDESVCLIQSVGAGTAPVAAMTNSVRGMRVVNTTYDAAVTLAANATTTAITFAIPLVSIVGSLTDKYFPLFACSGMGSLRLEIQLAPTANVPFVVPTAALSTFTISNVEYVGQFIELSDQAMSTIRGSLEGADLAFAVDRWANVAYSATLGTSTTQISMPVPFKYSSITSLLLTQRLQSTIAGQVDYDAFSSANYNISEYWLNLGSMSVPTKHPNDLAQMFSLYQQALGSPGDLGYVPNISRYQYITASTVVASGETAAAVNPDLTVLAPSFALGMDMSGYPSSDSSQMFSGFNSQSVDIFWNMIYNGQAGATNIRYDAYCGHQAVITFGANGVQIRY